MVLSPHRLWEEVMPMKKVLWLLAGILCAALLRQRFPMLRSVGWAEDELLQSVGRFIARQEVPFVR